LDFVARRSTREEKRTQEQEEQKVPSLKTTTTTASSEAGELVGTFNATASLRPTKGHTFIGSLCVRVP
jgi:hypothetical protein